MRDEIYLGKRLEESKILIIGTHKGIKYEIITTGSHPCCYIYPPKGHSALCMSYNDIELGVHGGLTYGDGEKIGWDYAHCGDFVDFSGLGVSSFDSNDRKWTLKELEAHCIKAIKNFLKLKKKAKPTEYYLGVSEE